MKANKLNETRFFKVKDPVIDYYCPLCNSPRQLAYGKRLNSKNWLQILLLTTLVSSIGYPFYKERIFLVFFLIWPAFEIIRKLLYRRDLICSECGFDPVWYRRDVIKAKQKVETFFTKSQEQGRKLSLED